jgi:hypothetical protein
MNARLTLLGALVIAGAATASCERDHTGRQRAETLMADREAIGKRLDHALEQFRDANKLTADELQRLLGKRTASPGFSKAWFMKGGVIPGDASYQSRYYGDRNVVSVKPASASEWTIVDLGPRETKVLVIVARGQILGSMEISDEVTLPDVDILMFAPDKVFTTTGKALSGDYYPRQPAR